MVQVKKMVQVKRKVQKKKVWASFGFDVPLVDVTAVYDDGVMTIKGPKGEISKKMRYPGVKITLKDNIVNFFAEKFSQTEKKIMFTYKAHLNNMANGVKEGYEYALKVVYSKFPMTIEQKNGRFIVKNFLGERVNRTFPIPEDVKVVAKGQDITVSGIDKEKVGQIAANLEQLTKISHLDRRVIQDGLYIVKKPHMEYGK